MTERTLWYHVDGIVCYACTGIIEQLCRSVDGVLDASASYVGDSLRLIVMESFQPEMLSEVLSGHGYRVKAVNEREAMSSRADMRRLRMRILICFLLSLTLVPYPFFVLSGWVRLITATAVQILAGLQFYRDAYYALSAGSANMSVLVSLGTFTAYLYSAVSVIRGQGPIFFESSGTVLVLVMLGKYLERSARTSSAEAVQQLLETGPQEAILLRDGKETVIRAEALRKGDRFLVRRNERFPADGVVLSGSTRTDESALTGESRPVCKSPGSSVLATSVNMDAQVVAEADRDYGDSVYSRMRKALLNGVNGEKAAIQKLADRVCARFIPAVLLLSVITLFLWYGWLAPGDLEKAVRCAIAVLIVACPCAMGIATPMAVTAAMGALGKSGIYVKGPAAVETLSTVRTVVFDKTGTLTLPDGEGGERLRAGAVRTVDTLRKMGLEVWMLSGDTPERASSIAAEVGIPEARLRAGLLPEEKAGILQELRQNGPVCMVGDGLNDALCLQNADVGIAIGKASTVSLECADVVITRNRITHVLKALYFGKVTMKNIRRSLFWALIYNIAALLLSVCGVVSPVIAGAAMSLSSLSVVLNAQSLDRQFQKLTFEKIVLAYGQ